MYFRPKYKMSWHKWFAWYPVWCQVDYSWVWLETVDRRVVRTIYDDWVVYRIRR